jgi:FAD/FMN-containing dehydrogenase
MDLEGLQRRIRGRVTAATQSEYEDLRRDVVWHDLKPPRYPALVAEVTSEQDVVEVVRFARAQGMKVAVRGGGHNWAGFSLRDGSLMVHLGRLNEATIDRQARTAAIQPVVRSRDFNRQLAGQGLSFPVGHCPTVPLGGFLLNGGLGWNSNAWRPACFSVMAANVVTAAGELVVASEEENADLLWAVRGAGPGFFGVVTKYFLKVFPGPRAIMSNFYYYPLELIEEVGTWFATAVCELPEEVEVLIFVSPAPADIADRCRSSNGYVCLLSATAFVDAEREAAKAMAVLDDSPLIGQCLKTERLQPTPIDSLLALGNTLWPEHHRYKADTVWSNSPSPKLLAVLRDHFLRAPSQQWLGTVWFSTGENGVASQHPHAAFSMTGETLTLCYAIWKRPEDDAANVAWHREMMNHLDPFAVGHYVGESDIVSFPVRHERSFASGNWQRLASLRRKWDPDGLFHGPFCAP